MGVTGLCTPGPPSPTGDPPTPRSVPLGTNQPPAKCTCLEGSALLAGDAPISGARRGAVVLEGGPRTTAGGRGLVRGRRRSMCEGEPTRLRSASRVSVRLHHHVPVSITTPPRPPLSRPALPEPSASVGSVRAHSHRAPAAWPGRPGSLRPCPRSSLYHVGRAEHRM